MAQHQYSIPPTDIVESDDGFHLYLDLPGVTAENLSIDLEQNEMTILAKSAYHLGENTLIHSDFGTASFKRAFTLSDMVDRDNIRATIKDGVLDLFLPKAQSQTVRSIEIKNE